MNTMPSSGNSPDMQNLIAAHRGGVVSTKAPAAGATDRAQGTIPEKSGGFSEVLRSRMDGIRFSAHATTRMKSRNIEMTPEVMGKLEKAVSGAESKGARDSLILMKDLAFIVNIPNRTVITAMDGESIRENVFTNIDSAVIAD